MKLFCKHEYRTNGMPYIAEAGHTKYCDVICIKCNKERTMDIFSKSFDKVIKNYKR